MIVLRSDEEIRAVRKAGKIVALTLEKLKGYAKPGMETLELDKIARDEILSHDGYPAFKGYKGYPGNICVSLNEAVVHGIASSRRLRAGDLLSLDVGVRFRDYYADAAITLAIDKVSDEAARLMAVTKEALHIGIDKARPGNRLSDISHSVQEHVESNGFNVVRAFVGHGICTRIHEEPEIPNYGIPGKGPRLEAGMILAIEPMVNAGTYEVEILEDGWTAVTKDRR
ncbi:MAG: type I methionyl aminopeptidase, partial [Candidatus Omnitrophica bacterium]|nr:type I methionyl aminopeptidase [Candidatus Omnitrophota bacterium]